MFGREVVKVEQRSSVFPQAFGGLLVFDGSASTCVELSLKVRLTAGMHWHANEIELGSWSERSGSER